jgi:TolB-like protein
MRGLRYLFEEYAFDTDRRELHRGADVVSVTPQVFDLLDYLIRNRERVVSKDDLINAIWNGRIVSDAALTTRLNVARSVIGDSGEEQRLIKTLPRKGFRFVGQVREAQGPAGAAVAEDPVESQKPVLALPDKPSIAVLPFQNMSGDPEQEYFADGIVDDITTALSRFKSLFVIARNSSFTYKGKSVDIKQVGRELGVRYVLEGSVRKVANRVRIVGQLIDALTGAHLWADRFDGGLDDIFDLQDKVTASVVGAIAPKLEQAEIERAKRKPTESLDAYDYYLRGIASVHLWTKEANAEALRLFYRASELDPDFATAYGMAAWCYVWRKLNGWMMEPAQDIAETKRLAERAAALGRDDAVALSYAGCALVYVANDAEGGAALVDRALVLNPNLAAAWTASGWVRTSLGETDTVIEHMARAMRLSPLDPLTFSMQAVTAIGHFFAGRYSDAALWAEKAVREQPSLITLRVAAASYASAGRSEDAHRAIARALQFDPDMRVSNLKDRLMQFRPEHFAKYTDALRKAGLPE